MPDPVPDAKRVAQRRWGFLSYANIVSTLALVASLAAGFVDVQSWWEQRASPNVDTMVSRYTTEIVGDELVINALIAVAIENPSSRDVRILRCEALFLSAYYGGGGGYGNASRGCPEATRRMENGDLIIPAKEIALVCEDISIRYPKEFAEQELHALGFTSSEILSILLRDRKFEIATSVDSNGGYGSYGPASEEWKDRKLLGLRISLSTGEAIEHSVYAGDYLSWPYRNLSSPCEAP